MINDVVLHGMDSLSILRKANAIVSKIDRMDPTRIKIVPLATMPPKSRDLHPQYYRPSSSSSSHCLCSWQRSPLSVVSNTTRKSNGFVLVLLMSIDVKFFLASVVLFHCILLE